MRLKLKLPVQPVQSVSNHLPITTLPNKPSLPPQKHQIITVAAPCHHFGDIWAVVNNALRIGELNNADVILKTKRHRVKLADMVLDRIICPVRVTVKPFDKEGGRRLRDIFHCNYFPTKVQWKPGRYRQICYQFDGRWNGDLKNPPPGDADKILNAISGVKKVRLGLPMELDEIIKTASKSDLFLGIDSGMAHLCHSVGIPMFLVEYKWLLENGHKGKTFTKCNGTDDAIEKVNVFLQHF